MPRRYVLSRKGETVLEGTNPVTTAEEIIDSRTVIARIAYLESLTDDADGDELPDLDDDDRAELLALRAFAEDAEEVSDWIYGETFVRDDFFEDYARELAEDIGAIDRDVSWPNTYIDWEAAAKALQTDYTPYEFNGETYWARA